MTNTCPVLDFQPLFLTRKHKYIHLCEIIIIIIMIFISIFHITSISKLCVKQFHIRFKQKIRIFKCCNGFCCSGLWQPPPTSFTEVFLLLLLVVVVFVGAVAHNDIIPHLHKH